MARIRSIPSSGWVIRFSAYALCCLVPVLFLSCTTNLKRDIASHPPTIRVRLFQDIDQASITATEPPTFRTISNPTPGLLKLPSNSAAVITLAGDGWRINNAKLGTGDLTIVPASEGTVAVNKLPHRGQYRFVVRPGNKFDVINDVDIDGYLAGVLAKELLPGWHDEAYKAQAIVARTYALYEKATAPPGRAWDVYADTRSQVYGGLSGETEKSRRAVNATIGVVLTYATHGEEAHIFKAYFSACCGGITQSAADAFGEPFSEPLSDQNSHAACNASPRFNWGPITISKEMLTRRFRAWGSRPKFERPEKDMATITEVSIQASNTWGRPTRFQVTDARQNHYSLGAEEFRTACNYNATEFHDKTQGQQTLYSSFVRVITDVDAIRFVEGHGWGHGVGMCQWCTERRAEDGMRAEDILVTAYQRAKLGKAY